VILIAEQSNAYLDVDPFLTRQDAKLVHENSLGHGGWKGSYQNGNDRILSDQLVRGPSSREESRSWRSEGGEDGSSKRRGGDGRRKWIDDEVGAWEGVDSSASPAWQFFHVAKKRLCKVFPLDKRNNPSYLDCI
jgi:hypothetical protein